jgi:LPS export ABC transporter permease LptG/LPS export ABC transporter permease LptF
VLVSLWMRKIDKLILSSVTPPFLITLTVLTFVVFMNDLGKLAELLITHNASPLAVLEIMATIAPGVLIFSLPLAFLIGSMIGLSGLSGESQITALRACGVPLRRLLRPVLILGLLVGLVCGLMSVVILPKSRNALSDLRNMIGVRQATAQILPRVFNEDFAKVVFYLDDLTPDREHWKRVFLSDSSDPAAPRVVLAQEATWITDTTGSRLQLHLQNGTIYEVNPQEPAKDNTSVFASTDIPIEVKEDVGAAAKEEKQKPFAKSTLRLWQGAPGINPEDRRDELIELHRRLSLPCSVFGFAFISVALGTFSRRSGRTAGSVLGMILALLYYVLFSNGMRLARAVTMPVWLAMWGADIILLAIGIALISNAEHNIHLSQVYSTIPWLGRLRASMGRLHFGWLRRIFRSINELAFSTTGRIASSRFPRILDSYISRGFFVYFLWSLLVCYALFVILTLFDLLDQIIRNKADLLLIMGYFLFLTPHILTICVPVAILLSILILFGVLEKGSEVTAMKAGGWSLYRIALPVLLIAGIICSVIYFMQDYILPYANIRQDTMRNEIKGRPPQTFFNKTRKWIFGQTDWIYNYDYYNPDKDVFIGLNIYEVDLQNSRIKRRISARQATLVPSGRWVLEDGWERDFDRDKDNFRQIAKADFSFPESAAYFRKEIFEPKESSKMTYLELRRYIDYLKQSAYNATELQVQLHMKISFPLSCFVMALIGIPFSFFMGRKGAFFGITASVAIAISYWGMFRIFEQMGAYGILSPVLASWAPNVMFGAAGLSLLLTIKT